MGILDVFKGKRKQASESNTLFGQTVLGNNVLYNAGSNYASRQMLYVTTSAVTESGRLVDQPY